MTHRRDTPLAWAEALLRAHRRLALRYCTARSLRVERKPDHSPVTDADRALEERFRRAIARAFPQDGILGEEFGRVKPEASAYWTIDPIDGTRAFTRGLPTWGMLLARVERGTPVVGACDFPALRIFVGAAGPQAYERTEDGRRPLPRARPPRRLADAVLFHGGSRWWLGTRYAAGMTRLVRGCFLERSYGDCYAYLWVLRGRADAMIDFGVKPWDLAPFAALARATGRVVTHADGRPGFDGPDSIFAHPRTQRWIVRALAPSARPHHLSADRTAGRRR